jgi:hypothetical protein
MRNRKYLIGALVGAIGALAFSGVAQATPISMTEQARVSPAKQPIKKFGGASEHNIISWGYDNFATSQQSRSTLFTFSKDVKFVSGNIPACPQSAITGKFTAQAQAACPQSIVGTGTVALNGGAVTGLVTLFSGGPHTQFVHTDIGPGATTVTIVGTMSGPQILFTGVPNTPGLVLTKFDTTFNKRKSGKSTYYFMARCGKKKKWSTTATTSFYSGETLTASSTQKCKQKK